MTGLILAGGENRRLPFLKGLLTIDGKPIVERSLEILKRLFGRVIISTNQPELYFRFGVPLVGDVVPQRGPMTGILSAFVATTEESLFVVACDMPYIREELISYMADAFRANEYVDAVIPLCGNNVEPLFAVYGRSIFETMEAAVMRGEKSLHGLIRNVRVRYISESEVRALDPRGESFVNINTMEDYESIGGKICLV